MEKEHQCLQNKTLIIISSGFHNNTVKGKIHETFWLIKRSKADHQQRREINLFN